MRNYFINKMRFPGFAYVLFRGQFSVLITSLSFYNVLFKTSARDIAIDLINMSLKCLDF